MKAKSLARLVDFLIIKLLNMVTCLLHTVGQRYTKLVYIGTQLPSPHIKFEAQSSLQRFPAKHWP